MNPSKTSLQRLPKPRNAHRKQSAERVTVVIRGMFSPEEAAADASLAADLEADVQAEAAKLGPVEKVRAFKTHPDGVVTVKFKGEEGAAACVARMAGRWFGGRQLAAHMWDGSENFNVKVRETAEQQAARLEAYARELEGRAAGAAAADAAAAAADAAADAADAVMDAADAGDGGGPSDGASPAGP